MDYDPAVRLEWHERQMLSRTSLAWIREHADAGDLHPIPTAVAELRRLELEELEHYRSAESLPESLPKRETGGYPDGVSARL